ncbi:glycosyltransferase, partial [Escherichia coli]
MKILVYGINYSPELTGIGKYTGEMVEWLAAQGHEVRVITAPPYYPQWQVGENYSAWRYKREEGAATVWRCPLYVPKQPSTLKRLLHLGSFAVSSFFPLMAQRLFRWLYSSSSAKSWRRYRRYAVRYVRTPLPAVPLCLFRQGP